MARTPGSRGRPGPPRAAARGSAAAWAVLEALRRPGYLPKIRALIWYMVCIYTYKYTYLYIYIYICICIYMIIEYVVCNA